MKTKKELQSIIDQFGDLPQQVTGDIFKSVLIEIIKDMPNDYPTESGFYHVNPISNPVYSTIIRYIKDTGIVFTIGSKEIYYKKDFVWGDKIEMPEVKI